MSFDRLSRQLPAARMWRRALASAPALVGPETRIYEEGRDGQNRLRTACIEEKARRADLDRPSLRSFSDIDAPRGRKDRSPAPFQLVEVFEADRDSRSPRRARTERKGMPSGSSYRSARKNQKASPPVLW